MKKVENKVIDILIKGIDINKKEVGFPFKTNYGAMIFAQCNKGTGAGGMFTYNDNKSIQRIEDLFKDKKDNEIIEIELSDLAFIKQQFSTATWAFRHIVFNELTDYINSL